MLSCSCLCFFFFLLQANGAGKDGDGATELLEAAYVMCDVDGNQRPHSIVWHKVFYSNITDTFCAHVYKKHHSLTTGFL